jgi:hypothetical protein
MSTNANMEASAYPIERTKSQISGTRSSVLQIEHQIASDPECYKENSMKTTIDGRIALIPQPSDDPRDPLNWSSRKKHAMLAIVVACSFLPDYGSVTGAATLTPQAV